MRRTGRPAWQCLQASQRIDPLLTAPLASELDKGRAKVRQRASLDIDGFANTQLYDGYTAAPSLLMPHVGLPSKDHPWRMNPAAARLVYIQPDGRQRRSVE